VIAGFYLCVTGRTNIAGGDPGIDARGGRYHQAGTQEVSAHIVGVTAAASESGKTAADGLGSTARLTAESEALGGESTASSTGSRRLDSRGGDKTIFPGA
jgi:hypothetical protein